MKTRNGCRPGGPGAHASGAAETCSTDKLSNIIAFPAHVSRQSAKGVALARVRSGLERTDNALGVMKPFARAELRVDTPMSGLFTRISALVDGLDRRVSDLERTDNALHSQARTDVDTVVEFPISRSRQLELADGELHSALQDLSRGLETLRGDIVEARQGCSEVARIEEIDNVVPFPAERSRERTCAYHMEEVAAGLEQVRAARRALETLAHDARRAVGATRDISGQ